MQDLIPVEFLLNADLISGKYLLVSEPSSELSSNS